MADHQDWTSVVWKKSSAHTSRPVSEQTSLRGGTCTEEARRLNKIEQKSINGEYDTRQTVSRAFTSQLQRARLSKVMTQKKLASAVNEKATVINDFESGKAVPNQHVIQKLNRALGIKLVSTKPKK